MYKLFFTKQALKDLDQLKAAGISEKAKKLTDILRADPFQSPPRFEKLVGKLDGLYSRRINIQHRLVYQVEKKQLVIEDVFYEGTVKIIRMWTHYQ